MALRGSLQSIVASHECVRLSDLCACKVKGVEISKAKGHEFRDALFAAQMSILGAIDREASREGSYDGPRNISKLTMSLSALRAINAGTGWFSHAPLEPWIAYADDEEFDDPSM